MNEKDWVLLETLWEEKNITKTAKKLYLSQPAITKRVQQLEQEFKCSIVLRRNRGIEFSSEGEALVRYAQHSMRELKSMKELIDNRSDSVRGTLRIGCANIFAKYRLPRLLHYFCGRYPEVDVNVRTGYSRKIYGMLLSNDVHAAIVRGNFNWPEMIHTLRTDSSYYVISSAPIDMAELPSTPRIHNLTDSPLETEISNWWQSRYSRPPLITMEVDSVDICLEMVKEGLGYGILSGICLENTPELYKERVVFSDGKPLSRPTKIYCREDARAVRSLQAFIDCLETFDS